MNTGKQIKPLPYPIYFWTVAALALAGLAASVYLSVSHYRVYTDIGYKSFCAISRETPARASAVAKVARSAWTSATRPCSSW